ncbi:tail tubular protein A [Leptolyngbya phage LPP-1]|uniref:Tail tubular protein A n=1 Tax=Leptolyngbya phage LPP-1 TaxID=2996049 RepID=A0AAE9PVY9_9CAUD|nr:tail tubular protein A [Leptolyngbya phage LPP-1]
MPTTSFINACNEVLLNVGELELSDFTTPVGRKAQIAYQRAIRAVSSLHAWQHLMSTVSALSWNVVGDIATLTPIQELYSVTLGTDVLRSVGFDELYERAARLATTSTPLYFSRAGQNEVLLYPAPSVAERANLLFRVMRQPTVPALPNDNFTLPDDFYDLVSIYAEMLMHRNHTTDIQAMQACQAEFELRTHMIRSRQTSQVVGNMGGYPQ